MAGSGEKGAEAGWGVGSPSPLTRSRGSQGSGSLLGRRIHPTWTNQVFEWSLSSQEPALCAFPDLQPFGYFWDDVENEPLRTLGFRPHAPPPCPTPARVSLLTTHSVDSEEKLPKTVPAEGSQ